MAPSAPPKRFTHWAYGKGRIDGKDAAAGGWLMQIETNVGRVLVAHGADGRVLQSLPLGNGTFNVFEQEAPFGGIA